MTSSFDAHTVFFLKPIQTKCVHRHGITARLTALTNPVSFHVLDELQSCIIRIYKHTCLSCHPSFKQTKTAQQIPVVTVITQKLR